MRVLAVALAVLVAMPVCAQDQVQPRTEPLIEPEWEMARLYLKRRGKEYFRGRAIYMTDSSGPSIGFTCQKKKVYVFVSVKALSLGEILERGFRNPAEWKVQFQVNDDTVHDETWIWTYGGRVFMSKPGDSANYLFKSAREGATLMFHRDRGDPVTFTIPKDEFDQFGVFVEKCGLDLTDFGSLTTMRVPSASRSRI